MAVQRYGRMFFIVDSNSREELEHLVDMEPARYWVDNRQVTVPAMCNCESFQLRGDRPCRHIRECADFLVFEMNLPPDKEKLARKRIQTAVETIFL